MTTGTVTLPYVLTAAAMIAIPGPDVLLLSSRALQRGGRSALRTLAGTVAGYAVVTLLVAAGLGAVLARWEGLLTVLRVAAVAYLLWLALGAWRSAAAGPDGGHAGDAVRPRREWLDGLLTATLNPKGLLFFLALLPPFLDGDAPAGPQLLALGLTFCGLTVVVYGAVVALTVLLRSRVDLGRPAVGRGSALVLLAAAGLIGSGAVT